MAIPFTKLATTLPNFENRYVKTKVKFKSRKHFSNIFIFLEKVSWIRRKDFQLLSVGEEMYINDDRFFVSHSRHSHYQNSKHSQIWFLHLKNVEESDEGEYECQTSNHPHMSTISLLQVQDAYSVIKGPKERIVTIGSKLQLICSFKNISKSPKYVFWYQGKRMINYDISRGITVETDQNSSTLTVSDVQQLHSGNYTCEPSSARPAWVEIRVANDEDDHAMIYDTEQNAPKDPSEDENEGKMKKEGSKKRKSKTPVRQLGVISASSTGPKGCLDIIIFLLHILWVLLSFLENKGC